MVGRHIQGGPREGVDGAQRVVEGPVAGWGRALEEEGKVDAIAEHNHHRRIIADPYGGAKIGGAVTRKGEGLTESALWRSVWFGDLLKKAAAHDEGNVGQLRGHGERGGWTRSGAAGGRPGGKLWEKGLSGMKGRNLCW